MRIAMMAITTSSSMSVNPRLDLVRVCVSTLDMMMTFLSLPMRFANKKGAYAPFDSEVPAMLAAQAFRDSCFCFELQLKLGRRSEICGELSHKRSESTKLRPSIPRPWIPWS